MKALPRSDVAVAGIVTAVVLCLWSAADGGYAEVVWYPAGIVLLLLLVVLRWAKPPPPHGAGAAPALVVAGLAAYACWAYLSILWAGDRGLALTGANRTLVYLLVLVVVLDRSRRGADATTLLALWALVTVGVGVVELVLAALHGNVDGAFNGGRLSVPIDYANANAALFVLAAWPLLYVSQSALLPIPVRALALAGAGAGAELGLLAQSKGAALATFGTLLVLLACGPRRLRLLVAFLAVAGVVAAFHGPLLAVFSRLNDDEHPVAAVRRGADAVLLSLPVLAALGAALAWADRRLLAAPRRAAALARAAAVVVILGALAGAGLGLERLGHPVAAVQRAWHSFEHPPRSSSASSHFVTGAGNHRYDFWRVAARQFERSPALGAGIDNFSADYARERRSSEEPLYPHSLEARLLGGTGIVGFLLFALFAGAAWILCLRATRAAPRMSLPASMALAMLTYWLAHGSVDWLWEFPALSGPTIAAVACVAGFGAVPERRVRPRWLVALRRLSLGAAVAAAAVALVPAWLAARDVSLAIANWRTNTPLTYARLSNAARMNPLSDEPYVVAGTIAERHRDWTAARRYFVRAVGRDATNWYSQLELGIAQARLGDRRAALLSARKASTLDPREPLVSDVVAALRAGRPISVSGLDRLMVDRTTVLTAR